MSVVRTSHPHEASAFIGRATELNEVRRLIQDTRLVTVIGAGGVGKTRLATRVVRDLPVPMTGGAWFVDVSTALDASMFAGAIATATRLPAGEPAAPALTELIGDRPALLVLDNCEHLVTVAAEFCRDLLSACAQVRIIVTSRTRLGLPDERIVTLEPMRMVAPESRWWRTAATPDAIELFVRRHRTPGPSSSRMPRPRR